MDVIIKRGRIIDPSSKLDIEGDILIKDGKIQSISKEISAPGAEEINAKGLIVMPGLIDMHAHLRDPGDPEDESIETGSMSAAKGGFTSVACMANTNPPIDTPSAVKYVVSKAKQSGVVNIYPVGAVTLGLQGKTLVEMGKMIDEGAVAFSDDGKPVADPQVLRHALEYAKIFGVKIISHSEETSLSQNGQMNEGKVSVKLGLKGIPAIAEEIAVLRDINLAKEFGALHITHISTKGSVEAIRRAKKDGIKITCDTCPHYFYLTEEEVEGFNTFAKVNPPLRTSEDVLAIIAGLKDGTIDAISTDHAPHKQEKKELEFALASCGMVGFETAFSIAYTALEKELGIKNIIEKLSINPSKILGIKGGSIKEGATADITIVDPSFEYVVDPKTFASKSKNSPFGGKKVKGKVLHTIVSGKIVLKDGALLA